MTFHKTLIKEGKPVATCSGKVSKNMRLTGDVTQVTCKACLKKMKENAQKLANR